jgi:hypothetical protein
MTFGSGGKGNSDNGRSRQPPGSMIGVGIAIGAGFGVAMGVALDNLALGIAMGAGIGVAIGAALEQNRGGIAAETTGAGGRTLWVLLGVGLALLLTLVGVFLFLRLL